MENNSLSKQATRIIEQLRQDYDGNQFKLEFQVNQRLEGKTNENLRKEIVKQVKGFEFVRSKCTPLMVAVVLKNNFDQLSIF
jgi:hypothetical protein